MISVELTFTLIKKSPNIKLLFEPSLANIKVVTGTYGKKKQRQTKICIQKSKHVLQGLRA